MSRLALFVSALALSLSLASGLAHAEAPFAPLPNETHLAAEHDFAFGVYASGWAARAWPTSLPNRSERRPKKWAPKGARNVL